MTKQNRIAVCGLLSAFVLANVFVPSLLNVGLGRSEEWLFPVYIGTLAAQAYLLAIWCVYSSSSVVQRIPNATGFLVVPCGALVLGLRIMEPTVPTVLVYSVFSLALTIYVTSCLLLRVTSALTRLRIQHLNSPPNSPGARVQFGITRLLAWTTAVAMILVVGKLILPTQVYGRFPITPGDVGVVLIATVLGTALFLTPVLTGLRLLLGNHPWFWGLLCLSIALITPLTPIGVLSLMDNGARLGDVLEVLYLFEFGLLDTVALALGIVRLSGFRLIPLAARLAKSANDE